VGAPLPERAPSSASALNPAGVVTGSFQALAGCEKVWDPACTRTQMVADSRGGVGRLKLELPAGFHAYKLATGGSFDMNWGARSRFRGENLSFTLEQPRTVRFYWVPELGHVTSDAERPVAVVVGSFQAKLGCEADWSPQCLVTLMPDVDGDGVSLFETRALPAGTYEAKVALGESWDVNYGEGGAPNGANLSFTVEQDKAPVVFRFDAEQHRLTVSVGKAPPQP
jgi:pullulanase